MPQPLVTVGMAVCNAERFLAKAIESVLSQSLTDFEFVIVDYGSTDNSKTIISHYAATDKRVEFREVPTCVLPVARNAACSQALGKYIAIMDADDVCLPDRLALEVDFMERHPEVGLIGGAVLWVDASDHPLRCQSHPIDDRGIKLAQLDHCAFWHPTVLFRKEAFTAVGGYRRAFVAAHDYDLELRISERYKCANLDQVVLKYRIHPEQISMRKRQQQTLGILAAQRSALMREKRQEDVLDSVDVLTPELLTRLGVHESVYERQMLSQFRAWIQHMNSAGQSSVALETALEVLRDNWVHAEEWQIADLCLTVADLYWKKREFLESLRFAVRAIRVRPKVLGRPLRPWLQRIGLIHAD